MLYDVDRELEIASAQLSGTLGQLVVADGGQGLEVFVPSSNGYVYVLATEDLSERLQINNQIGVNSVAVFEQGFVMVGGLDDQWSDTRFKTYDTGSGQLIDIVSSTPGYNSTHPCHLRRIPGKLAAIAVDLGLSPPSSYYISVDASGAFIDFEEDQYHGDHPLSGRIFDVAPGGEYFLSANAASVYSANAQMAFRGALDHSGLNVGDFAFSVASDTIFSAISPSYNDETTRGVIVTNYPSRLRDRVIVTAGFCAQVFRMADGRLGSIQVAELPSWPYDPIVGPAYFRWVE